MTLIVGVFGDRSLWVMADRRITYPDRVANDACKLVHLVTSDGAALIGYAGLGVTAHGNELSSWISRVLRGRGGSMSEMLRCLKVATKEQLPAHLMRLSKSANGQDIFQRMLVLSYASDGMQLHEIDVRREAASHEYSCRLLRIVHRDRSTKGGRALPPRLALAGSGQTAFLENNKLWQKLIEQVLEHERGKASFDEVATKFAEANLLVHRATAARERKHETASTVGSRCVVKRIGDVPGNGCAWFDGTVVDKPDLLVPTIVDGLDINAIADVASRAFDNALRRHVSGTPVMDEKYFDEIRDKYSRLDGDPDEILK